MSPSGQWSAAVLDRRHHLELGEAHVAGVGTARYARVASTTLRAVKSPLDQLAQIPSKTTVKPPA